MSRTISELVNDLRTAPSTAWSPLMNEAADAIDKLEHQVIHLEAYKIAAEEEANELWIKLKTLEEHNSMLLSKIFNS